MRDQLLSLLEQFNRGQVSEIFFLMELENLNRNGIWQQLSIAEAEAFHQFFTYYASAFDPEDAPRKGLLDRLHRWWDDSVGLIELKAKSQELEQFLHSSSGLPE